MFTGIIECFGIVKSLTTEKDNLHIEIDSPFSGELKVDQSVSHNGVCLTVTSINGNHYTVTAIKETLLKTNLGSLKVGDAINLERSMVMNGRIDGHIVQGHVDTTAICSDVSENNGSWRYTFEYAGNNDKGYMTVEKGSVCINGVSLTVVDSNSDSFSVAIIPYTFENTNFKFFKPGTVVNLEFDIIGKYVGNYLRSIK